MIHKTKKLIKKLYSMNRIFALCLTLCMVLSLTTGCRGSIVTEEGKLSVVCSIFPIYDWTKNITEDAANVEVTLLADNGTDLHSYQPSASDIVKISSCDVFIYVGGESDAWVKDVLKQSENSSMTVISLMDVIGDSAKEEEIIEGMQETGSHLDFNSSDEEETEYDEHVWLSLKNAEILCSYIAEELEEKNESNSEVYKENTDKYLQEIDTLDEEYSEVCRNAKRDTIIFADRFPFRYMMDDYNLKYYAAFSGCSAETEASFKTVKFLADKLKEIDAPGVAVIGSSSMDIANTVIETAADGDYIVVTLNSLQAVAQSELKGGITYLAVMEENMDALEKLLN